LRLHSFTTNHWITKTSFDCQTKTDLLEKASYRENFSSLKKSKFEIKKNENFWIMKKMRILAKKREMPGKLKD